MEEMIKYIIILTGYIALFVVLTIQNKAIRKTKDTIYIKATEETKNKLKAYAMIKGFNNEAEYISYLIEQEIKKDQEKLK